MVHMIGNAHIDPVWLWRWQEGFQEVKATFRSALDRLEENEGFVFTCACACYYAWVEDNAPEIFEEIKTRVAEGRWRIVGGMWIQPDCNIPSGESFARQFLYSKRYFMEKFGVDVKTAYNVDSFGHSWSLPELFRAAGVENYVMMRPGVRENADIPGYLFDWYSADGSKVRTFRIPDAYSAPFDSCDKDIERALEIEKNTGLSMMCFYGVGNHGGGPTIKNLKAIDAYKGAHPEAEVVYSTPDDYFEAVKDCKVPEWKTELQHHASGCYSATSLIKRLNRLSENALISAETMGVISRSLTGREPGCMARGWKNLMFNQFHDVMCGCSIREAYDDARDQHGEARAIADREFNSAAQKISWSVDTVRGVKGRVRSKETHFRLWELDGLGTPVVVFNPSAFERKIPVQIFGKVARATDENDREVPVQIVRASRTNNRDKWDSLFIAEVPALGYRLYWTYQNGDSETAENSIFIDENSINNGVVSIKFDENTGALSEISGKNTNYLAAPASMKLFDNEFADTWAHMEFKFGDEKAAFGQPEFEILETGPVRAKLRVTTRSGESKLIQEFSLLSGDDQVNVEARLDLREKFRMAKLCFPVNAEGARVAAEIAAGAIERECDGCEETMQRWVDISSENGGIAILNDGRYSFSAEGAELRVTVANSSIYADHYGQQYRDSFCRHADMGETEFSYAIIPHAGKWTEAGLPRRGEAFNMPGTAIGETYHEGPLAAAHEGISGVPANLLVTAIKRAEDGLGHVVRVIESEGKPARAKISAKFANRDVTVDIAPWQIKTYYLPDDAGAPVREVLVTEN